jgi:PAS domain S-box-containing protein
MNSHTTQQLITEIKERAIMLKENSPTREELDKLALKLNQLSKHFNAIDEMRSDNAELQRELRLIESERAHYRDLFLHTPDGYLITDAQGSIQEANLAAERMFLLPSGQYGDKALIVFVPPEERRAFGEVLSELDRGKEAVERDIWITPPGAPPFPATVKVTAVRSSDGRLKNLRWLIRDITRSQQAEESLYRAHDALDQRLQERNAELADVNTVLQEQIEVHMRVLEALRRSEQELSDFFDNASVGLYCVGPDGIIIRCNQTELNTMGYTREEYVGHHINEFHADPKTALELLRRLSNNETVQQFEAQIRCKTGSIRHVLIDANVLWEDGQFVYSRCFTRDITRRKQTQALLRESEDRFKQVAENIREVFWLNDQNSKKIVYVSPAYEQIWGRRCEDLYANPHAWLEAVHPSDREMVNEKAVKQRMPDGFDIEYRIVRHGGEVRWVRDRGFPVRNESGEIYRFAGISEDITARKQAEEERSKRLEEEAAHKTKDEFLATVAHELRTPLTAILGWTQLLRRKTLDEPTTAHALGIIDRNTQLQAQLIEDLLDASRMANGRMSVDMRKTDMRQVIEAAVDTVRLTAEHKCIQLETVLDPTLPPIIADPDRLQQVVWNLLANAIKFTPPGGTVELTLVQQEQELEITVKDSGQGIPAEFLPRLFERFSQAESVMGRRNRGLGLGLAIVRHIVELHSGSVMARSEGAGRGSTFNIRLPLKLAASETVETQPIKPQKMSDELTSLVDCNVLLVDNDLDSRESVKEVLEHCGAIVRTASSSREGLKTLEEYHADVILCDLKLQGEDDDGHAFIQEVRAGEGEGAHTPAAAFTVVCGSDEKRQSLASGFQMHLLKPIPPAQLTAAVASLRQINVETAHS